MELLERMTKALEVDYADFYRVLEEIHEHSTSWLVYFTINKSSSGRILFDKGKIICIGYANMRGDDALLLLQNTHIQKLKYRIGGVLPMPPNKQLPDTLTILKKLSPSRHSGLIEQSHDSTTSQDKTAGVKPVKPKPTGVQPVKLKPTGVKPIKLKPTDIKPSHNELNDLKSLQDQLDQLDDLVSLQDQLDDLVSLQDQLDGMEPVQLKSADIEPVQLKSDIEPLQLKSDIEPLQLKSDIEPLQLKSADIEPMQLKSADIEATQLKSADVEATQLKFAEVKSTEVKSTEVKSTEVKSAEVKSLKVKSTVTRVQPVKLKPANKQAKSTVSDYETDIIKQILIDMVGPMAEIFIEDHVKGAMNLNHAIRNIVTELSGDDISHFELEVQRRLS